MDSRSSSISALMMMEFRYLTLYSVLELSLLLKMVFSTFLIYFSAGLLISI